MMTLKIKVVSDLHLEFADIEIKNNGADVLILSGDICLASALKKSEPQTNSFNNFYEFFARCSRDFPNVVYIMGNHEHYRGDYALSGKIIKDVLSDFSNIHFLDKGTVTIEDVTFIGGTLWTDMNKEDPITINGIQGYMNDYRIIKNSNRMVTYKSFDAVNKPVGMTDEEWINSDQRLKATFRERASKFSPEDSVEDHKLMLNFIDSTIKANLNGKYVVVGHHAPSKLSTKPRYQNDTMVNGAYSSDLSEFILDRPQIKVWTHGHTHNAFDYMVGSTRIVCNPRGYDGYEADTGFNMDMLIEV